MFDTSIQETDSFLARSMRVLLSIASPRDRELLAEQLRSAGLTVVSAADDDGSIPQFDLCVVDRRTYPSVADTIEARREALGVVQLPVLMVLGPNESERRVRPYWDSIDDVFSVPTSREVFRHRLDGLVSTRRQSEQLALFARAMDDAQTGICIATAGGDQELEYVNDAFLEITGYSREEVLGRNCRFLQGPRTEAEPVRELRRAIDEERAVSVQLRNYRKDGEIWWNELKIAPVYGEDGVTHFVGFQEDVTDSVAQTKALRRYEEIVTAAGEPIYALDNDLRFTLVNDAMTRLAGKSESEILGRQVEAVLGKDHAEVLGAAVLNLAESDTHQQTIGTVVEDTQGRSRRFQTTVARLPTEEFEGVVCVSRDITEDRERESRLSVLDRVLRHNLRNKLMVIQAQVEQIRWHSDSDPIVDSADTVERTAEELLELAETAREFKRTVDPAEDDGVGPVDVGSHLCHAVEETGVEYGEATILADVPRPLWATAHDSFELAMTELLERAATAGEEVTVRVALTADRDEGDVHISVSHDGTGLQDVELEALNSGIESDLQHTQGLGLWFVRWMAVNSGGTFSISNTDSGTSVELTLPLADPPE
ncbi:PAS domain S-box protein [Haloarcula onubensis]|uniref:PAS domain S-box protein n=1 Tax=Haloarcula onubensis TaxID=2950539 RepID=A0ABU2FTP1_9EURY|nr:PAS domain S-box protein [Halomicroarcula sp. S3CR25-11]MDS0284120.1 PAS domain S-box protein [Halomicroarcula sp. S3CR25-11]